MSIDKPIQTKDFTSDDMFFLAEKDNKSLEGVDPNPNITAGSVFRWQISTI